MDDDEVLIEEVPREAPATRKKPTCAHSVRNSQHTALDSGIVNTMRLPSPVSKVCFCYRPPLNTEATKSGSSTQNRNPSLTLNPRP